MRYNKNENFFTQMQNGKKYKKRQKYLQKKEKMVKYSCRILEKGD